MRLTHQVFYLHSVFFSIFYKMSSNLPERKIHLLSDALLANIKNPIIIKRSCIPVRLTAHRYSFHTIKIFFQVNRTNQELTEKVAAECKSIFNEDYMIVGTSAMIQTEIDCIVNQYSDKFANPMVLWGKYRKGLFKSSFV